MKKLIVSFAIITALIVGCKTSTKSNDAKTLTINLEPKSNSTVTGTATFTEKNGKVIVSSLFNILTAPVLLFMMGCVILVFLA